jgi:hypothetical protein
MAEQIIATLDEGLIILFPPPLLLRVALSPGATRAAPKPSYRAPPAPPPPPSPSPVVSAGQSPCGAGGGGASASSTRVDFASELGTRFGRCLGGGHRRRSAGIPQLPAVKASARRSSRVRSARPCGLDLGPSGPDLGLASPGQAGCWSTRS